MALSTWIYVHIHVMNASCSRDMISETRLNCSILAALNYCRLLDDTLARYSCFFPWLLLPYHQWLPLWLQQQLLVEVPTLLRLPVTRWVCILPMVSTSNASRESGGRPICCMLCYLPFICLFILLPDRSNGSHYLRLLERSRSSKFYQSSQALHYRLA